MKTTITANCHSEIGPRSTNQDAVVVNPVLGYAIIADGMGGVSGGREASGIAVGETETQLKQELPKAKSGADVDDILARAVRAANKAVFEKASQTPDLKGMGTTIVALALFEDKYHVAHVGDSRAYLIRNKEALQLTKDHSLVQERVDAGLISPEDAENQIDKNIITKAIGVESFIEPDISSGFVEAGDIFVLTTDGVHAVVSKQEMLAATIDNALWPSAEDLALKAVENQTTDNSTAAVLTINKTDPTEPQKLKSSAADPEHKSKKGLFFLLACILALTGGIILAVALFEFRPPNP